MLVMLGKSLSICNRAFSLETVSRHNNYVSFSGSWFAHTIITLPLVLPVPFMLQQVKIPAVKMLSLRKTMVYCLLAAQLAINSSSAYSSTVFVCSGAPS